jgi:two-component system chemotaxis response regulator CheY
LHKPIPLGMKTLSLVLVVDDSASFRAVARIALERAGHQVIEAEHGEAGLKQLDGPRLSCILSDLNMPRMDGATFVENVRLHSRQAKVPIIMFSTEANVSKMARCRDAGVRAWLSKPFLPHVLVQAVAQVTGMNAHNKSDHAA